MSVTLLIGPDLSAALDELATLRLEIFAAYPYLYQGTRSDELAYLRGYAETPDGCALLIHAGECVVGAATGMPLRHEDEKLRAACSDSGLSLETSYYVGELLLQPAYRNAGHGQRLLARLEDHVRSLGHYQTLTCATVVRPGDHPLQPPGYLPISRFLARTGFRLLPGVTTTFTWCETDGVRREHGMQFWVKDIPSRSVTD